MTTIHAILTSVFHPRVGRVPEANFSSDLIEILETARTLVDRT